MGSSSASTPRRRGRIGTLIVTLALASTLLVGSAGPADADLVYDVGHPGEWLPTGQVVEAIEEVVEKLNQITPAGIKCWRFDRTWNVYNRNNDWLYSFEMLIDWCGNGNTVTSVQTHQCFTYPNGAVTNHGCTKFHSAPSSSVAVRDQWQLSYHGFYSYNPHVEANLYGNGGITGEVTYW